MFEPLTAQQGAGAALMTAALGLLVLAWLSLRTTPKGFAVAGALFLLSLAARAFLVPYLFVVGLATFAARRRLQRDAVVAVLAWTGLAVAMRSTEAPAAVSPASDDPRAQIQYWRARDNGWRARGAALAWARSEKDSPGEGYAALAQVDWELGERDRARRVLTHVIEHATDDSLRLRATRLREAWSQP